MTNATLQNAAPKTPHVLFVKLDVDDLLGLQSVARHYKIKVFPSIVFFKENNVIERLETTEEEDVAALITLHDAAALEQQRRRRRRAQRLIKIKQRRRRPWGVGRIRGQRGRL
ncbi:hypothetical protein AAHA92_29674 [Salvia divinorum]|uniref:Thioredoxin domain-containing protein n=1 Tax=Salvia divinorum TaxID=28513 RepID=A0ABD1FZ39_SALDI